MASLFSDISLDKTKQIFDSLGFKKLSEDKKKGSLIPYNLEENEWLLITYQYPKRQEKVKVTQMKGKMIVQVDCGKKQRPAWKTLATVEELKQHFNL